MAVDEQADKIKALHAAATDFVTCKTEQEVYECTVRAAENILEFDVCCTMIHDDDMLRPKAISSGAPPNGARPMEPDEGAAGKVYQSGEPFVSENAPEDDVSDPAMPTYKSGITVPIGDVGVFQAVASDSERFGERHVELIQLLLTHTEAALERVALERDRRRERERFQSLIEHSSDVITILEADGTIRYVSPSFESVFGYDSEAVVGDIAFEYVHPDDHERVMTAFWDAVDDPDLTPSVEYRFEDSEGNWLHVSSIGTNRLDDPAVEGFVVNSRNVTERKERLSILAALPDVAADLREAETPQAVADIAVETAHSVLDLPITGLWLANDDGTALEPIAYTEPARELIGDHPTFTSAGDSLSWRVFDAGEHRVYDDVRAEREAYNEETPVRSEMILSLGDYGVINIGSTERKHFQDVDQYFAAILAAVTAAALERVDNEGTLRRQNQLLASQNERLDSFASMVSHDLRNPLNIASAYLHLFRENRDDDHLSRVEAAHDRMESLIDDILTLAREGRVVAEPEPVQLATVAAAAWESVDTADATLDGDVDATVRADASRLQELLENLFRNAVEHGGESVTVHLDTYDDGFAVADDGAGIPEDDREDVFETGFTTSTDGTGLGLSIVSEIADAHGWKLTATESEASGARFEFTGVSFE